MLPATEIPVEQEAALVGRARQGDRSALESLVEPLRRPLFAYIYRMVTLPQDAEDLLQDVLLRALEGLPSFCGEARFKTWLFGIATVLGFTAEEAAGILGVSEPVFHHRLSAARSSMISTYEGLCQLINKNGPCWQCKGIREFVPEANRGADLVEIQVAPGLAVTPENLFDARLRIVCEADLEGGRSRPLHDDFFGGITRREEG